MNCEMRTDAELLNTLLNEGAVILDRITGNHISFCAKVLAQWTDLSVQTISEYRTGVRNIPVSFWKRVLAHCPDWRIISLMVPDQFCIELYDEKPAPHLSVTDFLRKGGEAVARHGKLLKYIADIVADGRIDELDRSTIQQFFDEYERMRTTQAQLRHAIRKQYADAVAANNGGRS